MRTRQSTGRSDVLRGDWLRVRCRKKTQNAQRISARCACTATSADRRIGRASGLALVTLLLR